jgi:hypothetical protein
MVINKLKYLVANGDRKFRALLIVLFMYSYCYIYYTLCILCHCVVLCAVSVCNTCVLLSVGFSTITHNKTYINRIRKKNL